jgi:hypothetical protein
MGMFIPILKRKISTDAWTQIIAAAKMIGAKIAAGKNYFVVAAPPNDFEIVN